MNDVTKIVEDSLRELSDEGYKTFQQALIPTVSRERIIGVRTPELRRYARSFGRTDYVTQFMNTLPHDYYDEDNLHAFLIEQIGDFEQCIGALDKFLPYVDNWATCDMMSPRILATDKKRLLPVIYRWTASGDTYTVRFGILCLMRYYLDDDFKEEYLYKVSEIESSEYYVNMARAWFFATALAKQWSAALSFMQKNLLDTFTHNKTVGKAADSLRLTSEQKEIIKKLRK